MTGKSFVRIFWLAIYATLAAYFALTLWLGIVGLTYPYQLDYGEGIVLWFAREFAHGHNIYSQGCCASSNYPPLAMILSALLMPIFGDGYISGRLLNFAAAILVAALIYRIVSAESRDQRAAALAALFFIGSPYIYHWVPLFRADLLGLGFTFAGIYFAWRREQTTDDRRQKRYLLFAIGFFLLALYTKQTLIAAPAAAFFALFRRDTCTATHAVRCKCKRVAILFALALGSIGGAIYLAIDFATRGGFTFGLIDSNATVFLPDQLLALFRDFVFTFAPLLGLATWEWVRRVRAGRFGVWEAYAVTTALTLGFAGRVGAWENYFFEAIAIVCVFAGLRVADWSLQNSTLPVILSEATLAPHCVRCSAGENLVDSNNKTLRSAQGDKRLPSLNYQLPITLLLLLQLALYTRDHDPRVASNLIAQDYPANQQLAALLSQTNGTIISEDMGALVTSGKPVSYYTFQYSSLARAGKWDESWELNGLRDGMFPLVILERGTREDVDHYRRFTREFVSNLDRYYARTQTIGKYEIYTPAPIAHPQSANFGDAIAMVGWSVEPSNFQLPTSNPSTSLRTSFQLTIVWQARRTMPSRYTAFVHLENANGEKISQDDREPRGGLYPTTRWALGEMVRETATLNVPGNLSAGKYFLRVGWYDTETGERLLVPGSADDAVVITTFEVRQ